MLALTHVVQLCRNKVSANEQYLWTYATPETCFRFSANKAFTADLHKETCKQGSPNVDGVAPGAEGGRRDRQLDSLQSICELSPKSIGHQQGFVV